MKHIIFEFIGGAWDGMSLSNRSADSTEAALATYAARMTVEGRVGRTIVMPREYAVSDGECIYIVVHRIEVNDESLVRLECGPEADRDDVLHAAKTVILQFRGGCLDGRTLRSDSTDSHLALVALAYYSLTERGTVGTMLEITPCLCNRITQQDDMRESAMYQVTQRLEDADTLTVALEYRE